MHFVFLVCIWYAMLREKSLIHSSNPSRSDSESFNALINKLNWIFKKKRTHQKHTSTCLIPIRVQKLQSIVISCEKWQTNYYVKKQRYDIICIPCKSLDNINEFDNADFMKRREDCEIFFKFIPILSSRIFNATLLIFFTFRLMFSDYKKKKPSSNWRMDRQKKSSCKFMNSKTSQNV